MPRGVPSEQRGTCQEEGCKKPAYGPHAMRCQEHRIEARKEATRTPLDPAECAYCGERFQPYRSKQKFCQKPGCNRTTLRQRERLEKPEQPSTVQQDEQRRAEIRELRQRLKDEAARDLRADVLATALQGYRPTAYKPPPHLKPASDDTRWVIHLSDWHIGQETLAEATGGLSFHSHEVARAQLDTMLAIQRDLMRDYGKEIESCLVVLNGDMLDGDDMRNSQHRDIEMLASEQFVQTFDLVCYVLSGLLSMVKRVVISSVGGNHDRLTRQAGNAGLGELGYKDTYAWMMGEMLKRRYADEERVEVINWGTFYGHLRFGDHRIVHAHGSDIRWGTGGHSGIPWNAISVAAARYAAMLGEYDLLLLGHGHINARLPIGQRSWVCLNGSLPGTSTWIQSSFKSNRTPIQQLLVLNRHGLVAEHPLYLDVGQVATRADVWGEAPAVA